MRVDALIPAGNKVFLFDFAQSRYQVWEDATCGREDAGDSLPHRNGFSGWLALSTPGTPFAPTRATLGPNGHFFVLDRLGQRLGLYDTHAQFISSLPLPREIKEKNLERLDVFWTRDGIFTFLDAREGWAWQYTEIPAAGKSGDWRLVNRLRLPVGLESCLWEPYSREPCCRDKGKTGSGAIACFDRYFTSRKPAPGSDSLSAAKPGSPAFLFSTASADSSKRFSRVTANPAGGWTIQLTGDGACSEPAESVCYQTEAATLEPCP